MPPERVPDPTLPPGWEALYDTTSGSKYYWNPTTNAVTYDRPVGGPPPPSHAVRAELPALLAPSLADGGLLTASAGCLQASNGYGGSSAPYANGYGSSAAAEGPKAIAHSLPADRQNFNLSASEYREREGLRVEGSDVPDPLQSFDSVGFPRAIMDEVYL